MLDYLGEVMNERIDLLALNATDNKGGLDRHKFAALVEAAARADEREWVGMTNEELDDLHRTVKIRLMGTFDTKDIYRAIEQRLKEKNSG